MILWQLSIGCVFYSYPFLGMKPLSEYEQKIDKLQDGCPIKAAIDVIRGRWKPMILWELNGGRKRFSDLQAALPEIAAQVLTVQLRQLEADGVIIRTVYPEIPTRVEYALTELGHALSAVMDQLEAWGTLYLKRRTQHEASERRRVA
jgi:DNA-binding HxlR family transcriptional regulator